VILTPHCGGFSSKGSERIVRLIAENVRRFSRGEPLLNVVDKQRGY
jgi:phosphoglycerate dehydrogenase-like enzyme